MVRDPNPSWLGFRMKLPSWQSLAWLTHLALIPCTVRPPTTNHIRSNQKSWLAGFSDVTLWASCSVWVESLICSRKSWFEVHLLLFVVFWVFLLVYESSIRISIKLPMRIAYKTFQKYRHTGYFFPWSRLGKKIRPLSMGYKVIFLGMDHAYYSNTIVKNCPLLSIYYM